MKSVSRKYIKRHVSCVVNHAPCAWHSEPIEKGRDIVPVNESKQSRKRIQHHNETLQSQRNQHCSPDLHSSIMQYQKANGNRATELWVKSGFQGKAKSTVQMKHRDMTHHTDVAQMRGENPHNQAGAHDGWELSAHHIVAHTKLMESLKTLKDKEGEEKEKAKSEKEKGNDYQGDTPYSNVLLHAIPDVLTKKMLDILKVDVEDSDTKREEYRQILLDKSRGHDESVFGIKLGDVRESFFEWQGGNQYMGPNTSIRTEPTSNKDDIDFDGQYFSSLSSKDFKDLTDLGGKLGQDSEKGNIESNLKAILDITKNVVPEVFDSSKWTEIGSLSTLEALSKNVGLNRDHILKYSFFKLGLNEIGSGNKYADIVYSSGDYEYKKKKTDMQIKGTSGFIPIVKAKTITPTDVSLTPLLTLFTDLGVEVVEKDDQYIIPIGGNIEMIKGNKRFKVKGYKDTIPCSIVDEKIVASKDEVDAKEIKVETQSKSLYDYCKDSGMATSSYLPKELYDQLMSG